MNRWVTCIIAVGLALAVQEAPAAAHGAVWSTPDGLHRVICTPGGWLWYGQIDMAGRVYRFVARGQGSACAQVPRREIAFGAIRLYPAGNVPRSDNALDGHISELPADQSHEAVIAIHMTAAKAQLRCLRGSLCTHLQTPVWLEKSP